MFNKKKIIAIILARSGSKRLKNKNIKLINNKPLIYWTIKEAQKSKLIDKLVVSTDSANYINLSKKYGVKNFVKRPKNLSSSRSTSIESLNFVLKKIINDGETFDYCLLLEPTSPLREVKDINLGIKKLIKNTKAEALVSVSKVGNIHPQFMYEIKKNSFIRRFSNKLKKITLHSHAKELYFLDGSIYISKIKSLFKRKSFYHEKTLSLVLPKWKSYEVDDFLDFKICEMIMKFKKK